MSGLDGTTEVPGVGKVQKKYVVVALVAVAGIVGFVWYRRSQADDSADPGYYADTRTGSNTGSDTASDSGNIDTGGSDDDDGWKAPKTDQEWTQQVLERLTWYEPGFVSATCGKYLSGLVLTADEATLIREAWAQVGRPPGGQQIKTSPTGPTPPTPPPPKPPTPPKPPAPKPPAPPKPPAYWSVKVVKFTTKNPPWNSTISGIAGHYGKSASSVWNDSKNAPLRAKRKRPDLIRPGDIVYVRK